MTGHRPPGLSRRSLLRGAGAAAATAAVGPTLLTGCGSSAKPKTLRFWNMYSPSPDQGKPDKVAQDKWFRKLVKDWNDTHDVKVELEYVTVLGDPKQATAFAAGDGPDIFLISPGDFLRYYNGGVLADLTPYMDKAAIDDFYAPNLASRVVDGKVYALPMEIEPLCMFYSKPALEKAHITEAELPTTWDGLMDLGDKLLKAKQGPIALPTIQGYYQNFTFYPWLWQTGADVIGKDGQSSGFGAEGAAKALGLWRDLVKSGVSPRTMAVPDNDAVAALSQGYASVSLNGIWTVAGFHYQQPKFPYGVFPLPAPEGGKPATALGGWAFVANAQGRDPETAARFCTFALGGTDSACIDRIVDWCTKAKSDIAPRASAQRQGEAAGGYDTPVMKAFAEKIFPTGRGEPRYPPVVYKAVSDALQACQLGGADPHQQAELAGRSIDAYLRSYQGARLR